MVAIPRIQLDPHPFARGGSAAICTVSAMHIIQAFLLLYRPHSADATGMIALLRTFHAIGSPDGAHFVAAAMILSGLAALVGAIYRVGWIRLAVFLPQHLLLGIMTVGAGMAVIQGSYLDGTVMPWGHILCDQLVLLALFIIHSSAIVRRARDPNG